MKKLKDMKGFTLIELIVVVIIIGVLAAIAAVAYNQYVAKSRSAAALASAVQLRTAIDAYSADSDLSATAAVDALVTANPTAPAALDKLGYSGTDTITYMKGAPASKVYVQSGNHVVLLTLGTTTSSPSVIDKGTDAAPITVPSTGTKVVLTK